MKKVNWEKVTEFFEQAIMLKENERISFLKQKCGDNKELFEEVVSLLEADENIHSILEKKASEIINIEDNLNFVGQNIGNYKLIEEIASGGMGTVFLAERSDGVFNQKVALKIIKPGLSTIPIIRRFQQERQILANLQHPNIARLFDGGVTEDRRPFFTMEYVDGIAIDKYCDEQKLTINERLKLFSKICDTVKYAHNNLVIHRDLKPSNILVKKDGNIKLLDFGISKVLSAEENTNDLPPLTQTEINLMTPEYSSPEQIKNNKVSVSTDVYSLGLILYKLLSGKAAHNFKTRTYIEYERVICEQTITKPSTILLKSEKDSEEDATLIISENRKTQPKKLKKNISGDLDNICMMALRKDPERRYTSVEMFSNDISRYLNHLPIVASKESFFYSSKKFVVRNKKIVSMAAALFVIVNSLIFYYTFKLKTERDRATIEAKKSEQVTAFLEELFLVAGPDESKGETITARELLDRGALKISKELNSQPEVKTNLLFAIGKTYQNLGLYKHAEELFLESKIITKNQLKNNKSYVESLLNLANLYRLDGKYELAKDLLLESVTLCKKKYAENYSLLGDVYLSLGGYFYEVGDYKQCEINYNKAENLYRKHFGDEDVKVADAMFEKAHLEYEKGNLEKAEEVYTEVLKVYLSIYSKESTDVATVQNALAQVFRHMGNYKKSSDFYEKSIRTRKKLLGKNHPDVALSLNHFSRLYYFQEMYDKAEPLVRESLKIRKELFDENHPEVIASKSSLAGVLAKKKKYKEAEVLYKSAYNSVIIKLGESHPYSGAIYGNIGKVLLDQKKYEEAEKYLSKSISMLKKNGSSGIPYLFRKIIYITDLYNQTARYDKAQKLLEKEIALVENISIKNRWQIPIAKSQLGYSLFKQDKNLEAEGLLVHGYNVLSKELYKTEETQKALNRILEFYESIGRKDMVKKYSSKEKLF
ncbi:MAG: serine/threonine-protein kinase [Melioribacteraceae bacterium]